jgi:uracil-DNA glycosylase family 4
MSYAPRAHGARCDLCPLRGSTVVPPTAAASRKTRLVFVGEAPGRKEELVGAPFKGMTGTFLRGLCREVDLDIRDAHLTNAALCRSNLDSENERAAVCCAPRLLRELAALPPEAPLVALGKAAALSILGTRSIMHARGFVWTARTLDPAASEREAVKARERGAPKAKELRLKADIIRGRAALAGRTVMPTVHPAFVLRSDTWLPILKLDLDRVARLLRGTVRLVDAERYRVESTRKGVRSALKELGDVVAVDIETAPSSPGGSDGADPLRNRILCVGLSDGNRSVVVWPFRNTHAPLLSTYFRRARSIVMHNGYNFDQIALARAGVELPESKLEDTLLAHHTFASHLPQRLAHVASVYCDVSPWKITFKRGGGEEKGLPPEKLSGEELCKYNVMDCILTVQSWLRMQPDLESERAVYETDKENARLCRAMIVGGIGVDLRRREELRAAVKGKASALKGRMRSILNRPEFHPMQLAAVRKAIFTTLRAPLYQSEPTASGVPSTSSKTLERLKSSPTRAGRFADLLLRWRGAVKIRSTYLDAQVLDPTRGTVGRTHFNWRSYGAGSGRYSCRLQSCPRAEKLKDGSVVLETRVREVYAPRRGCLFVYHDLSQAEMRVAAYASGDATFIKTCEGDIHTGNAKILFPDEAKLLDEEPKGRGKPFRDVAKNAGFGVTYLAEAETVFQFLRTKGFDVRFGDVVTMMERMREAYAGYFRYVGENVKAVSRCGHMRALLSGRVRWLGWHCPPTEVANFPIQSMIADLMNVRLPRIAAQLPAGASVVAQIHDAAIIEVPKKKVDVVQELVASVWKEPVVVPAGGRYGGSLKEGARSFVMPIDLKVGQRWSDFG